MNGLMIFTTLLFWLAILSSGWLGWQLLRQNGRILLRLDELEKRLDAMDFGDEEAQTSSSKSSSSDGHSEDQSLVTSSPTNRFKERSLVRSKIKRDGLKVGTHAPDFRLPRLDGRGELGLSDFRGQRVLLVFSSPNCGPCNTLAPELEKFHRANRRSEPSDSLSSNGGEGKREEAPSVQVIMISKGEPKENRAKVKEHGLTFPIVLQQQWEISRRYAMFATPVAYLIDEQGVIVKDVAVGTGSILVLTEACSQIPAAV